jgi:biopolymer transport protein ExbD
MSDAQPSAPKAKRKHDEHSPPIMPLPTKGHDEDLIDMTAMVDIVFFILIFFLVTSCQAISAVIDLPHPKAIDEGKKTVTAAQIQADPNAINIKIEDDNSILVDDDEVEGEDALWLTLKQLAAERSSPPVMIIGSPDATHGTAVKVLDACASARLSNVQFFVPERGDD